MQTTAAATHGVSASKFVVNHLHLLGKDCGEIVQSKDPQHALLIVTLYRRSKQPGEARRSLVITSLFDNVGWDSSDGVVTKV